MKGVAQLKTWIASVADGGASMSQRSATTIERCGGIDAAIEIAQARGVHLLRLTDDKGRVLIAASRHPFQTLC